jgi:hypothetical protein
MDINSEQLETEKEQLKKVDSLVLIEYIKSSIEVLVSLKQEAEDGSPNAKRMSLRSLQGCADMLQSHSRLDLDKELMSLQHSRVFES